MSQDILQDWLEFLHQQGAVTEGNHIASFGAPTEEQHAALHGDILCDLSHYGLLRITGADSLTYMQGQFSNDVRDVSTTRSQLSGHLSPKGRLYAIYRLFMRDNAYYLRVPAALLEASLLRLRKYVLMSKVELADASGELLRIGVSGAGIAGQLEQALGGLPQETDDVLQANGLTAIRIAGPHPRFEVYGPAEAIHALWQQLAPSARPSGDAAWALLDIHAGLPDILPDNEEAFVPQMVNLQLVNGVSFRKGCYTGQEVVARMQYLGTLKRRMYPAHAATDSTPAIGSKLFSAASASGQGAGRVVNAQPAPGGGSDLLVVVQVGLLDAQEEVRIGSADGPALTFGTPPYPFPVEQE